MKIIPIASGKGGVGKTTFALNLALTLSKKHRTVLLDLDAGTSSIRNFLQMEVNRDLYHFLKKDHPIQDCMVTLDKGLDPERLFKGFRMIAAPKYFIHDIVNFEDYFKKKLIKGINSLDAEYVILDLKAGLDINVLEFLPVTNSGILIFTPQMKAATISAAEMARAALLRACRTLIEGTSFSLSNQEKMTEDDLMKIGLLMNQLEDGYNQRVRNFDDFFLQIDDKFQSNSLIQNLRDFVSKYRIYFVLNQFNGVVESAENIIKPFLGMIHDLISSEILVTNLGWVVLNEEIRASAEYGLPFLVMQHYRRKQRRIDNEERDAQLRAMMGLKPKEKRSTRHSSVQNEFGRQLDLLNRMYTHGASKDPEANFEFISERLQAISQSSIHQCGMGKILGPEEVLKSFSS